MRGSVEAAETEGAWKMLCCNMLYQAVRRASGNDDRYYGKGYSSNRGEYEAQRVAAIKWLRGGVGIVTYEDCCDALGFDVEAVSERLVKHIGSDQCKRIGQIKNGSRVVQNKFDRLDRSRAAACAARRESTRLTTMG